ncbi:hypothetical protein [Pseudomonas sp. 52 E 6]|nr:hypothetical protein [Pseudomonas sp. 52 E 6]
MIRPNDRITRNTKSMRQRVTPAKPQPAIHFHRTGAVQPCPLKRQNPIERTIGQCQQFLPGNHRYRAAIGSGLIRRGRRIASWVFRNRRGIVDRFLSHQHRPLGLVPNHRHRVGNHLIPSLQRHIRNRPDRRRRATHQQRLGRFNMLLQARFGKLIGQHLQPLTHPPGLDMPQHLRTQAYLHPHPPRRPDQKQIDQHLAGNLAQQFVHLRRREHAYPGHHR